MNLIKEKVSLKKYCSYKTGGEADLFAEPANVSELQAVLRFARENNINFEILGGGSNVLISDEGYRGLIICMRNFEAAQEPELSEENLLVIGAGASLNKVVNFTISKGLSGFENLAGIPGTIGGAAIMNAGAYGAEIKDVVSFVAALDYDGNILNLKNEECRFGYRESSGLKNLIVCEVGFKLKKGDREKLEKVKQETLEKRRLKQPLDKPSCGSVFKRPSAGFAGEYIEKCGLKGLRIGGAEVSEKHANFILNADSAKSSDIKLLIDIIIEEVYKKFNIKLATEVQFIGF